MRNNRRSKKVGQYDLEWKLIKVWPSMTECAKGTGIRVQNIWKICTGYKSTLNGFNFKYEED
jgi:hypothetical protein